MDNSQKRELIDRLSVEFSPDQIKTLAHNGKDYIATSSAIRRLNEVAPLDWSFEIIDRIVETDCVAVLARITIAGVVYEQWGSNETKKGMSLGDRLKSAGSDALKKCATHIGVGLHLYGDENDEATSHGTTQQRGGASRQNAPHDNGGGQNGNGGDSMTDGQRGLIANLLRNPKITDDERARTEASMPKLSKRGASELIDRMKVKINERGGSA